MVLNLLGSLSCCFLRHFFPFSWVWADLKGYEGMGGDLTFSGGLRLEKRFCVTDMFLFIYFIIPSLWPFAVFYCCSCSISPSGDLWLPYRQKTSPGLSFLPLLPLLFSNLVGLPFNCVLCFLIHRWSLSTHFHQHPPPCTLTLLCIYWSSTVSPLSLSHQLCSSSILS